jgi:hypothetical protein
VRIDYADRHSYGLPHDGIFYIAQPQGNPPTEFRLTESLGNRVVFENKAHDFPQRIVYWTIPASPNC